MAKKTKKQKQKQTKKSVLTPLPSLIQQDTTFWKTHWLVALLFLIVSFVLYAQCIQYGYVLDDKIVISENSYTKQGVKGIWKLLSTESFEGYFNEQRNLVQGGRYRPLSLITFALEHEISPGNTYLAHGINILLYCLCGMLLFRILSFVYPAKDKWYLGIPFIISLLYLAHPIHTEAVANIKGRDEIMAFILGLSALYYATKYIVNTSSTSLIAMSVCYYLGLLAKENVLTFLGVIPLFMMIFHYRKIKIDWKVISALLLVTILYLVQRYAIIGYLISTEPITDIMNNPFVEMNGLERFATVVYCLGKYLLLCIVPHPLTHDYYPYQIPIMNLTNVWVIISLLVYLGLTVLALIQFKKSPHKSFAWLFFVGTIFIVSNLVFNVGTFMNERFVFISSLGIIWILVHSLIYNLPKRFGMDLKIPLALLVIIALGYAAKTITRVPVWENAMTLNRAAVTISKQSARANSFMATALFNTYKETSDRSEQQRLLEEAQVYVNKSLDILPDYSNANLMAAGVAAELYKFDNDLNALLESFTKIWTRNPSISYITEYMNYLKGGRANDRTILDFYARVGEALRKKGEYKWALHHLTTAHQMDPNYVPVRKVIASTYRSAGDENNARKFD